MKHRRILLIDDDVDFVKLLAIRLEQDGFETLTATDPEKGIERARVDAPDVILLDLFMPVMDGYEVCKFLQADERTARIPIIILSSAEAERFHKKSLDWGADVFVKKNLLHLSEYLETPDHPDNVAVARKDDLDVKLLRWVIEKVIAGSTMPAR